jgi:SAM-dependent methyltransferase
MTGMATVLNELLNERDTPVEEVMARHFAPAYRQRTDGIWADWDQVAQNLTRIRTAIRSVKIEMSDELTDGRAYADRHVLTVEMTDGTSQVRESYLFGRLAEDGRFEQIDEVTLVTSPPASPDWRAAAAAMDATIPATTPVAEALMGHLSDLSSGAEILDLACGTGQPSLLLARSRPDVTIVGVDGTAAMIERAREKSAEEKLTNVRFEVMALESLELPQASVDAVTSQFGFLQHGDLPGSVAEMTRVLRLGGQFSLATWDDMRLNTLMSTLSDTLRGYAPEELMPDFAGATALAAPGFREDLLRRAGVDSVETALFEYSITLPSFDAMRSVLAQPATFGRALAAVSPEQQTEMWAQLHDAVEQYRRGGTYVFPVTCRLFWGIR